MKVELQSKNQQQILLEAVREKPKEALNGIKINDLPKFPYEDLTKPSDELPEGVNAELKEV